MSPLDVITITIPTYFLLFIPLTFFNMAYSKLGVALASVFLSTLVLLQLLSIVQNQTPYINIGTSRKTWLGRNQQKLDEDVFLLGAGKADITG